MKRSLHHCDDIIRLIIQPAIRSIYTILVKDGDTTRNFIIQKCLHF